MTPWLTRRGRSLRHALTKGVLVAVGAAASSWIFYVALGSAWSLRYLESQAEEAGLSLSIDQGSTWVPGSWSLRGVLLEREGAWSISAERVRLDLDLLDWVRGYLHVTELVLGGATLELVSTRPREEQAASVGETKADRDVPIELQASLGQRGGRARHIVIDHIAAAGHRIRVRGYELSGKLEYRARGSTVFGAAEARVIGSLNFGDAQVRYAGKPAGTASGAASVEFAGAILPSQSLSTALLRANWKVEAAGRLNDIGVLPESAPVGLTLEAASYRVTWSVLGARVERADLLLQTRRASLELSDTSRSDLSGKVELRVDFERQRPSPGRARLEAERWNLSNESGGHWFEVAPLNATLSWRETSAGLSRATLEATGELTSTVWNATLTGTFASRFEATGTISRPELHSGTGEVRVREGELVPHATPRTAYGLSAAFRVENANLDRLHGLEYAGTATLNGEDAGMLLDLAEAGDRVRWTLSMLEDQPFALVSRVTRRADALALADLKLTCPGLETRGAGYVWNGQKRGAFLIDGPARVGILLHQKSGEDAPRLEVVAPVTPHWLDTRLEDLAERWQARSPRR